MITRPYSQSVRKKHAEQACPRCGSLFTCKSGNSGLCQCNGIELGPRLLDHLADLYDDCLCLECLRQLKTEQLNFR